MKKTKTQEGITLVALIITIIILLILAVTTIGSIRNSKIIEYAQEAGNRYTKEQEEEKSTLAVMESTLDKIAGDNEQGGIVPPQGGENPETPPESLSSTVWKNHGLEVDGTPVNVVYNVEYSSDTLDLGGRVGYKLKIHSEGGLFNAFEVDSKGQEIIDDNINYFLDENYAYVDANFMSYFVQGPNNINNYVGINFKADGTADIYWEEPKNADYTGPITSIEGLTPVGTISIVQ